MDEVELPTWYDIEKAAMFDPVLAAAVTLCRKGVPRERVLIDAVLILSRKCEFQHDQIVRLVAEGGKIG